MPLHKLSRYITEYSVRNKKNLPYPVYSVTNSAGFCVDYFDKDVSSKNKTTYKIVPRGCFAYNPSRINVGSIDCQTKEDAVIVSPLYVVFKTSSSLSNDYLLYFLKSAVGQSLIRACTVGSVRANLKFKTLAGMELNVPSLPTQESMVANLKNIEANISILQSQIALLDEQVKSLFIELFGDPVENSKQWPTSPLNKLGSLERGKSKHRPRNDPKLLGGPYPLIQTGDVSNADTFITKYESTYSELGLSQSKMWKAGTLCITIAANIAQTAIMTFDACFPDSVVGFIPGNQVRTRFMHEWFAFLQPILEGMATSVAQKNLNLGILGEVPVMIPPIDMQDRFIKGVEEIDKLRFNYQQQIKLLNELLEAKMAEYFGGEE